MSSEDRAPTPRWGRCRARVVPRAEEFEEDEAPLDGVPSYREMPLHYGEEAWSSFASRALKQIGLTWWRSTPASYDPQTLIENEPPAPGLPDLCGEYNLPTLQLGHLHGPAQR